MKGGVGGFVLVGPLDKDSENVKEIVQQAKRRWKEDNMNFNDTKDYNLVYPDGRTVDLLPDGTKKFTLQGYREYKGEQFDRLRLYLVETDDDSEGKYRFTENITLYLSFIQNKIDFFY